MAEQKITLKVARKHYSLTIDSEKEEIYRLAEREVNAYISKWEKAYGENINIQDCLAFTALQFCINNISITRQNELSGEDLEALDALSQRMDKHLNRIKPHKGSSANKK
jgi:cell division protein ZapA